MVTASPLRSFITVGALLCGAALLIITRPPAEPRSSSADDENTASCLSNLGQIARAVALYSRDFDGKIPRGVDPEDHFNSHNWNYADNYGSAFRDDAARSPFLHQILRPYLAPETNANAKPDTVFRCPADNGWIQTRLPGGPENKLRNVAPSSFVKYGTSYYYSTIYGFELRCAADIENPSQTLLLFDGDLWHPNGGRPSLNGLFIDGHAQNLSAAQFTDFARE